jgi:hypothetical protein
MSKARELSKLPNYVLSTVAELKLAVGKEQGDKAFVGGYYADGDGGGGDFYWDAVSVEADNGGTIFQVTGTTTGRWKRIYSGVVNVKWFGLSESIDESSKMQQILDGFTNIFLDKFYRVKDITINSSVKIQGASKWTSGFLFHGGTGGLLTILADFCEFTDMGFDGDGKELNSCLVYLDGSKCSIINCLFTNMYALSNKSQQYGLKINAQSVVDFTVDGCRFSNIRNTNDDDIQAGTGFSGGIFFYNSVAHTNNGSSGKVVNCEFIDILTELTLGDVSLSDADGIRFFSEPSFGQLNTPVIISNCVFNRVQKSAIKASGVSGLNISNIIIKSIQIDGSGMLAGIRLQDASNSAISNISMYGELTLGINLKGNNIRVDGIITKIDANTSRGILSYIVQIQETPDAEIKERNIEISNIVSDKAGAVLGTISDDSSPKTGLKYFKDISISNVFIDTIDTLSTGNISFNCSNVQNLKISNVKIRDEDGGNTLGIKCINSSGVEISNCFIQSAVQAISNEGSTESRDISITDCNFVIVDSGSANIGKRVVYIRNNLAANQMVSNVQLSNITLSHPSYDALVNSDTFLVFAKNSNISNICIETRYIGQYKPPTHFNLSLENSVLSNIVITDLTGLTQAQYAIKTGTSNKLQVNTLSTNGSGNRGVDTSSSNNVFVDNIKVGTGETVVFVGTGTNITQGANNYAWA